MSRNNYPCSAEEEIEPDETMERIEKLEYDTIQLQKEIEELKNLKNLLPKGCLLSAPKVESGILKRQEDKK